MNAARIFKKLDFPRRAASPALCIETVSTRIMAGQLGQILFSLPFFPTRGRLAKNKEVWRMDDCQMSSVAPL